MTDSPPAPLSIFELLHASLDPGFRLIRCTKATLVHISHTLEDLVLRHEIPAMLFTGFQESSHWRQETERYRALAGIAQQVCIFAGGQLPPESSARELHITLRDEDPLRQEWFLAILSERFAVVLCGRDRPEPSSHGPQREFDTIWSFDLEVVGLVLDRLEAIVAQYRPERLAALREGRTRFPLRAPDAGVVTELTSELLRFEEELNRTLARTTRELEQQLTWRRELTEILVHDLRTPLQGLMQTLDLLRQSSAMDQATIEETTTLAMVSAANLSALIQVILDTSRLESDRLAVEPAATDPGQLLDEALGTVELLLRLAGLQYVRELDPQLHEIWCDPGLIGRVLQNLVGNAVKFTPAGGTVTVSLRADAVGVRVAVRDTGAGIQPAALPRIFDRYYRGAPRAGQIGSGIGLYFCRLAVEAHGGSISAESAPGSGTTITFTLPHRRGAPPRAAI